MYPFTLFAIIRKSTFSIRVELSSLAFSPSINIIQVHLNKVLTNTFYSLDKKEEKSQRSDRSGKECHNFGVNPMTKCGAHRRVGL